MDAQTTEDSDFIARIRALAPEIAGASDDIEQRRELPPWLLDKLRDGRFFRMLQPRSIGGAELRPVSFCTVTEAIAAADASTGWVVCQNNGCSMSAAYLAPEVAREIFGPSTGILAWGPPGAPFEAQPVEGGYRISGKWRFASGSHHATWLGAHMKIAGTGGPGGQPGGRMERTMLFPKSSVTMHDIWHVVGLRGTGSDEYVVDNLFVPENHSMSRDGPAERREHGLLYRFTSSQLYSCGFGGVGLGIARATMDAFYDLPATKTSRGAAKPMRENNVIQSQVAQCEARWRSARAFLHGTWEQAWAHVEATGEQTEEDRTMIRLASTWAIQSAREVVNTLYHAAGSIAIFEDHPFERRLRDIHTVAQQSQGRQLHYETVGQILLGMPPENQF
ncbi:MAG TPA: acyl-CoA dehydrogenase family protein [Acetobacteraceae bacterium]|nr:acyl-CoA dehydrogenase family protein [Acetobacteraceae bacterium]